jgi:diketogulonate reductase-like aldo/keto reductase
MERHKFGSTRRLIPVIGQGTWTIDDPSAIQALRRGLDLGLSHIDTAEMYGSGLTEEIVARAITGRRDKVFLVSKVLPHNASRTKTIVACEGSLKRLRTGYLDCYLLHWRGQYAIEETVEAFDRLQRDGKILSWGVSNFDVPDLEKVWKVADGRGPVCNQVLYHLGERAIEHAVIPWCEEHGVAVVGYSPFGHSGRIPGAHTVGGPVLSEIAAAHDATARQVVLSFLVRRRSLFTIPKAANPEHVEENAVAGDLRLTPEEIDRIDRAIPLGPRPRSLPLL